MATYESFTDDLSSELDELNRAVELRRERESRGGPVSPTTLFCIEFLEAARQELLRGGTGRLRAEIYLLLVSNAFRLTLEERLNLLTILRIRRCNPGH